MDTYQQNQNQYFADFKAKLTRDANNRRIAGVCSGLARYYKIDASIIRIIWFSLAFFGIFSAGISTT
ncbi:MAG TPA: PspC domain-containing protein, partial [Kaistella sp.]|nr:PspC domain-containing protein [Kaistella sp.]